MDVIVIASTEADAAAAAAVEQHHAQLSGALTLRMETLLSAAARGDAPAAQAAQSELSHWCERELLPHALAEQQALYPAARSRLTGRLLIDAMLAEHEMLRGLVQELSVATAPVRAAAAARALQVLFDSHLAKENELVLPLLVADSDVSVAALLEGMHDLLGNQAPESGHAEHACRCGEADAPDYPELDARSIPHAIRHATIFGALDAVHPGKGLILVAPHDPLPLLAQLARRSPGVFTVDYVERGPDAWRLSFMRQDPS